MLFFYLMLTASAQEPVIILTGSGPDLSLDNPASITYFNIDTALSTNVWQIGPPRKSFINVAFNSPNALITDTAANYPPGVYSATYMKFLVMAPIFEFHFRTQYDTDSLHDGGIIEMSLGGGPWHNIADTAYWATQQCWLPASFLLHGNVSGTAGGAGFSGRSDGWESHYFILTRPQDSALLDTIQIRFVFLSDSVNSGKEGWAVDNIWCSAHHAGINTIQSGELLIFPNPVSTTFSVHLTEHPWSPEKLEIFNSVGQLTGRFSQAENIDISSYPAGVYYLVATTANGKTFTATICRK